MLCQLQDEKKEMASRYQRLADEMRELGRRFSAKTAELHKQYGKELERQRKAFLSGEKVSPTTVGLLLLSKWRLWRPVVDFSPLQKLMRLLGKWHFGKTSGPPGRVGARPGSGDKRNNNKGSGA